MTHTPTSLVSRLRTEKRKLLYWKIFLSGTSHFESPVQLYYCQGNTHAEESQ